jgi:hypothetical protein
MRRGYIRACLLWTACIATESKSFWSLRSESVSCRQTTNLKGEWRYSSISLYRALHNGLRSNICMVVFVVPVVMLWYRTRFHHWKCLTEYQLHVKVLSISRTIFDYHWNFWRIFRKKFMQRISNQKNPQQMEEEDIFIPWWFEFLSLIPLWPKVVISSLE